jgi:predicted unusual protein kinase regulating ubiquinone biosynthesis (AarF/ABC1/UbiB family)
MTEEKKIMRRKVLAKWLKESLLRLGPTFIKIGQQFSTRVDILPQEYVDQLSELQVCVETYSNWQTCFNAFPKLSKVIFSL